LRGLSGGRRDPWSSHSHTLLREGAAENQKNCEACLLFIVIMLTIDLSACSSEQPVLQERERK
jgi:hypothetical protein